MKARASQAATAGLRMKLWRVSAELRQKASADPSELNLPPDSTTVSFPGIYYLDPADKKKKTEEKNHSVMQSNLNCPFVFVL